MNVFKSLTVGVKFNTKNIKSKLTVEIKKEPSDEENEAPVKKQRKLSAEYLKHKDNEIVNSIRKENSINVKGDSDKEKPIESFDELFSRFSTDETLKKNVNSLKYNKLTPVQMQVLPLILKKRQVKVCAPTGSGKCYCCIIFN
jgi:superfamily II RNA helicase